MVRLIVLDNTLVRLRTASGKLAHTWIVQIANILFIRLLVRLDIGLFVGVFDRVFRLRSEIADAGTSEVLFVRTEQLSWHAGPISGDSTALFGAPKSVRKRNQ